jgi:FlaA1/EpsC-like NDP-sugar epimerase
LNLFIGRLLLRYSDRFLSRWTVFGLDLLLVLVTYLVAQFIAFNFDVGSIPWASLPLKVFILLPVYALGFLHSSSYVGVVRHSGGKDFTRLFQATVEATLFLLVLSFTTAIEYNRTALVSQAMLFLILSVGGRLAVRSLFLSVQLRKAKKGNGIIIVGAGSMGRAAQNAIEQDVNFKDYVIAYLDDNKSKAGKNINGIPILKAENALSSEYIDKNNVGKIVIAIKNISGIRLKELSNAALELGIEVSRVPPTSNWVNGELTAKQIRPISLEELLGRDPINLSYETLNGFIKGKTVLITGAAGSIGSELVRQVMRQNPKLLVCLDQAETPIYHLDQELSVYPNYNRARLVIGSVTDPERMDQVFRDFKPEVVFHAAAYKHVPLMEENPQEAVKTNILGTHLMARLASEHRAECFVMVSTDKAVNPTNIMGASKRAAEHVVNYFNDQPGNLTRFVTTRFGNVLGSNGSVIPLFKKQLQEGGPITLTHKDITRYFMTIPEAVRLVLEAGHMGKGGEILVFDMGEPVKIYDLAVNLIKLSGLTVDKDIKIIVTGLRPGEKLYEELLADGETTRPTHHQQIFISTSNNLDAQGVEALVEAAKGADKGWIQYISEYEQTPQ